MSLSKYTDLKRMKWGI